MFQYHIPTLIRSVVSRHPYAFDYDKVLQITRKKLADLSSLMAGDIFTDNVNFLHVVRVQSEDLIVVVAGNPSDMDSQEILEMGLEDLRETCVVAGIVELQWIGTSLPVVNEVYKRFTEHKKHGKNDR